MSNASSTLRHPPIRVCCCRSPHTQFWGKNRIVELKRTKLFQCKSNSWTAQNNLHKLWPLQKSAYLAVLTADEQIPFFIKASKYRITSTIGKTLLLPCWTFEIRFVQQILENLARHTSVLIIFMFEVRMNTKWAKNIKFAFFFWFQCSFCHGINFWKYYLWKYAGKFWIVSGITVIFSDRGVVIFSRNKLLRLKNFKLCQDMLEHPSISSITT